MAAIPQVLTEQLINPVTGAVVDLSSNDSIIEHYKEADEVGKEIGRFKDICKMALHQRVVSNGTKTHRVMGRRWQATVVDKDPEPSTSALRQILTAYPDMAGRYIVPSGYRIDKQKYKVMLGSSSDNPQFNAMKNLIQEAINTAAPPRPSITKIERL